jgi:hypothetical protein
MTERQARAFERGVPGSPVVRIANGSHDLFITHGEDVLREVTPFVVALQRR